MAAHRQRMWSDDLQIPKLKMSILEANNAELQREIELCRARNTKLQQDLQECRESNIELQWELHECRRFLQDIRDIKEEYERSLQEVRDIKDEYKRSLQEVRDLKEESVKLYAEVNHQLKLRGHLSSFRVPEDRDTTEPDHLDIHTGKQQVKKRKIGDLTVEDEEKNASGSCCTYCGGSLCKNTRHCRPVEQICSSSCTCKVYKCSNKECDI
ncbi:uncharacterized protein PF11_0207-like isoform X1 [Pistacia vera]|uniref:uncharacterized protein PF11_0207-like isoform X1 n=1 Tax=Pistacia vera TaxID=55513 RepID=UPI001263C5CA|nr:uncharacterized protein PF11_0207-like isoform X1 [Pistacia vera]